MRASNGKGCAVSDVTVDFPCNSVSYISKRELEYHIQLGTIKEKEGRYFGLGTEFIVPESLDAPISGFYLNGVRI